MDKANKVCAFIDVQGFMDKHEFYPREIAILNNEFSVCYEIDCDFDEEYIKKHKSWLTYQRDRIHGLPIKRVLDFKTSRILKLSQLKSFIIECYTYLRKVDKYYIAIKNQQLANLLEELKIPTLNLERELIGNEVCPPLYLFDKISTGHTHYCPLHFYCTTNKLRCALRKSINIWNWLQMKVQSDILFGKCVIYDLD